MTYRVIYADPPWRFNTYSEKGKGRSAEAWYDCLSIKEIKALPVRDLAAEDCVLLLWVADPFLRFGLEVIESWGFIYKTVGFYWIKSNALLDMQGQPIHSAPSSFPIGLGYWTRANPEQCLLATRGSPHRLNADVRKLVVSPRREHSRKPDEMYGYIERLCPGPYVELFARNQHPGWSYMLSNEVESGPGTRRWKSSGGSGHQTYQPLFCR
jgi:N6-adenosine-specific RNA methylase IME4